MRWAEYKFLLLSFYQKKKAFYGKKVSFLTKCVHFHTKFIKIRYQWFPQFQVDEFEFLLIQKLSEHYLYSFQ